MPSGPNFAVVSAKLRMNEDVDLAYRQLDTLLARPYGDMFWMYGCAGLYFATQDVLKPAYKERIRWCWKHFTPYRGDTENHFLMYYGSLYLMTQAWPTLKETEWFEGKSSAKLHQESGEYLDHWIDETARYGMTEWDSPRYGYYYITPLILLAEYTKDVRMKHRFEMMLDLMLADYATDYLAGSYCGAHSRVSDQCAIDPRSAEITAYGDYFFADTLAHIQPDVAFAALSKYECPQIVRDMAHDREQPYEKISRKRGRQMIRYLDQWSATDSSHDSGDHAPVYKYDYMTKDYCLGSMQGGIVQPIQQQSWSLVFNSDKPHNIITGLHPYVSAEELGMFFPEYPSFMLEKIGGTKAGYKNENKWVGGSPYERIYQSKNVLVALYDLRDSATLGHVDIFIPWSATPLDSNRLSDSNTIMPPGWMFFQFDSTRIGLYCFANYRAFPEKDGLRVRLSATNAGYLIYCEFARGSATDFIRKLSGSSPTRTAYKIYSKSDRGATFHISLEKPPADQHESLYNSTVMESKFGSGLITIRHAAASLTLDFR